MLEHRPYLCMYTNAYFSVCDINIMSYIRDVPLKNTSISLCVYVIVTQRLEKVVSGHRSSRGVLCECNSVSLMAVLVRAQGSCSIHSFIHVSQ